MLYYMCKTAYNSTKYYSISKFLKLLIQLLFSFDYQINNIVIKFIILNK